MLAGLPGCHHASVQSDPSQTFQEIRHDFFYGNLDVAQKKAESALATYSARDPAWAIRFRLLDAEVLTHQGRRKDLVALLSCSATSKDAPSFNATGDLAIKRDLLCSQANARLGEQEASNQEMLEARRLADSTSSGVTAELLMTQGHLQVYRGHLSEAAGFYQQSLQAARVNKDVFLEAGDLLNLGVVALHLQHYDEALSLLKQANDIATPAQLRGIMERALGNAGVAYFYLGDYEKALATFLQAESAAKQIGTTSAQVTWLRDAATAFYKLSNFDNASVFYEQALVLARKLGDTEQLAAISTQLGFLLYDQQRFDDAKNRSDEALAAAQKAEAPEDEAEALFLQAMLATHHPNSKSAEQLLLQVLNNAAAIPSQKSAIQSELAGFYQDQHQPQQADAWYRKSIATYEADRAAVRNEELQLPFFANGEDTYRKYADLLIATGKPEAALQLLDQGRAKTLSEGLGKTTARRQQDPSPQAVAKSRNATVLFYSLGPEKSYLWAINAQTTAIFTLPKESDLATRIQAYNKTIQKSIDPLHTSDQNALSLYATLIAPAQSMLPHGSRVILIPDGALNSLNFESLLVPAATQHYWIEDATIVNANSIRMLSNSAPTHAPDPANTLLLIGNPVLSTQEYAGLPNAPAEVTDVQKHFDAQSSTTVTQASAIPASYALNHPEKFSYIHFVAHGTASELSPLDSAVVLSAPPGEPENFKLYAREIVHHPLHAKLVTISACYGSGLRAYAGEGLIGLSWAFLRAGAHNVIGALWEVNDASTPQLMDDMYTAIEAGQSPDQALRAAKLALIHSTGVYRKPLYWAAFQLYAGS